MMSRMSRRSVRCLASLVAGHIVTLAPDGRLQHFDVAGYVVVATSLVSLGMLWYLQQGAAGTADATLRT